ncbi:MULTISPECIES: HAD family hydrolase [unclassified Beijerinckia]|uniref:HAD family hydrolase n=1 Tax=unclassified Beijerinckia TaxID=2638183 RepID=UPI000899F07D|nr:MULTISPECIES: HAD family hydrolase [unclassified Beijerinckia]MDH7799890.1 putative hydrolase of the HAD superfamily [Beijerinckia sp. GAS462]SED41282.1 putative hydrolase of the HAD superfamily [Beijerinckia sp. 28-YEA-48]
MSVDLICLDADDTLWHNMRHFDATEAALLALLRPFAEANVAREKLNSCEARNLKLYGYGAKGFTLSMIEMALELGGEDLPAKVVMEILEAGRALLAHPVELFDDIENTLDALAERGRLVLVTKGDLLHQETKLAASGLGDRFSGIEIVSDKTAETFRRLFARYDVAPHRVIMAGDSMRSDILPALEAGAWAAFIPHALVWHHERAAGPGEHQRFRQLTRLAELPGWIDTLG